MIDVRQKHRAPAPTRRGRAGIGIGNISRRKRLKGIMVIVQCNPNLLKIAFALDPSSRLARLLNRGQQQCDQDRDDRDDDKQFDQRETLNDSFCHFNPFANAIEC